MATEKTKALQRVIRSKPMLRKLMPPSKRVSERKLNRAIRASLAAEFPIEQRDPEEIRRMRNKRKKAKQAHNA